MNTPTCFLTMILMLIDSFLWIRNTNLLMYNTFNMMIDDRIRKQQRALTTDLLKKDWLQIK